MSIFNIFEISSAGMNLQQARMETMASNLAHVNYSAKDPSSVYKALEVVGVHQESRVGVEANLGYGLEFEPVEYQLIESESGVRMAYEPAHPHANSDGYVAYPKINPVDEMVKLMTATRAYEANAQVVNAAKSMASTALEIGR